MRRLVPRFPRPGPGASQHPVPRCHRYYRFVRLLCLLCASSPVSLDWRYSTIYIRCREMQRSFPSSWGIPVNTCPGLGTPVALPDLALSARQMLPSARLTASASTTMKDFGAEFLTAHVLAIYASHPSGHPVEWQDSLPDCQLRLCPGWTFTNKIPLKGFIYSCLIPPFPSLAWRDSLDSHRNVRLTFSGRKSAADTVKSGPPICLFVCG